MFWWHFITLSFPCHFHNSILPVNWLNFNKKSDLCMILENPSPKIRFFLPKKFCENLRKLIMKTLPQWVFANCSFPEYVHGVAIVFSVVYFWTIRSQVFWVFEVGSKIFSPEATKLKILFAAERKKTLLAKTLIVSNSQSSFFCRISYTVYDIPYLTMDNLELYSLVHPWSSSAYLLWGWGPADEDDLNPFGPCHGPQSWYFRLQMHLH